MASASRFWPRPGLDLVVLLCNRAFSCKNRAKFENFVNFPGNNLKSYVVNHYLVPFHNYFWPRPRTRPHSPGLGLEVLASFNITVRKIAVAERVSNNSGVWRQFRRLPVSDLAAGRLMHVARRVSPFITCVQPLAALSTASSYVFASHYHHHVSLYNIYLRPQLLSSSPNNGRFTREHAR